MLELLELSIATNLSASAEPCGLRLSDIYLIHLGGYFLRVSLGNHLGRRIGQPDKIYMPSPRIPYIGGEINLIFHNLTFLSKDISLFLCFYLIVLFFSPRLLKILRTRTV